MAGENRILDVIEQFQKNPGFVVLGFEYTDDEEGKHRVYLDRSEEPMIIKIGKTEFTSDLLDIYKSEAEQEEVFSEWEALQARELSSLSEEETKRFHELQFKTEVLNLLQDLDERGVSEQIEESYSEKIATLNAGLTEMGNPSAAFLRGSIRAVAFQLDGHSITAEKARDKDGKVHAYYTMDGAVVRAGSPIMTEFAELWDKDNPEKFSSTFIDAYKENVHAMGRVNELTKRFLASDLEEVDFSYHEDNQENASKVKIKRRPVLKENGEYGDEASITINDQEIGDSPKDQLLFYDLVKTAGKNFSFSYEGALDKAISSHVLDGREEVSNAKLHVGELVEDAIGAVIKKMDLARIGRM
ncbi:MAG: hypothetical protein Q4B26_00365 [Eubacteriales bacterium]|nr:hypothetical protein [Eubacteriales bacterium]